MSTSSVEVLPSMDASLQDQEEGEVNRHSPTLSSSGSESDLASSTPSLPENAELDLIPSFHPSMDSRALYSDSIAELDRIKHFPASYNGKGEHNDYSNSVTNENYLHDLEPAHSSETESIGSVSSEQSTLSAPALHRDAQMQQIIVPPFRTPREHPNHRSSTPSPVPRPLHASANNVIHSGKDTNNTSFNDAHFEDSVAASNAPFALDNASFAPTSPQEHITKAAHDSNNNSRLYLSDKYASENRSSSGKIEFYRPDLTEDDDDGLVGLPEDDHGALFRNESPGDSPAPVHTLRPMQVRRMPKWFLALMILCISMIGFGSYAAYDAVAAVQDELMKDLNLTTPQFGLLYSIYSLPNIFLVILGGKMVDKFGSHRIGLLTTLAIAIGAAIVALAPSFSFLGDRGRYGLMLGGRFIFGAGAETSYVVQNSMCVKWFFGDHLATAMTLAAVGTRLGSISSFVIGPHLVGMKRWGGYTFALWIATAACIVSVIAVLGYIFLRSYAKNVLLVDQFDANSLETAPNSDIEAISRRNSPRASLDTSGGRSDVETIELQSFGDDGAIDSIEEDNTAFEPHIGTKCFDEVKQMFLDLRGFPWAYWGAAVLGVFTYGIVLGFRAMAGDAMAERYNMTPNKSNLVMASIDITGLLASPIVGWVLDYTFKLGWATLTGNILSVLAFALLIPKGTPVPGIVSLGLSSTFVVAAIYPAISYLTPPSLEGLAFGVTSSAISAGNLLINLLVAQTLNQSWLFMVYFLLLLSSVSVAVTAWWILVDRKSPTPVLNRPKEWTTEIRLLRRYLPFINL